MILSTYMRYYSLKKETFGSGFSGELDDIKEILLSKHLMIIPSIVLYDSLYTLINRVNILISSLLPSTTEMCPIDNFIFKLALQDINMHFPMCFYFFMKLCSYFIYKTI